jgi:outer membrane protein OmpA-like peptidoglycan-associated protein
MNSPESRLTGVGIKLEKHLSHYTSFQVGAFNSTIYSKTDLLKYKLSITQYEALFYAHITNGNVLRTWRNTQLYFYGGAGQLQYKTDLATDTSSYTEIANGSSYVGVVGAGAKYRIGNKTSLFIDGSYNHSLTDKLDGLKERYSNNDGYYRLSAGISYTLGKKRVIEWDNHYKYLVPEEVHDTTYVIKTIKYEAPKVEEVKKDSAIIYYLTASYLIEAPYLEDLDKLVDRAVKNGYSIEVEAYCDGTGSPKTNLNVIQKRADGVVAYLSKSIDASKINVSMFNETFATYAPEARNRRVIVKLIK